MKLLEFSFSPSSSAACAFLTESASLWGLCLHGANEARVEEKKNHGSTFHFRWVSAPPIDERAAAVLFFSRATWLQLGNSRAWSSSQSYRKLSSIHSSLSRCISFTWLRSSSLFMVDAARTEWRRPRRGRNCYHRMRLETLLCAQHRKSGSRMVHGRENAEELKKALETITHMMMKNNS